MSPVPRRALGGLSLLIDAVPPLVSPLVPADRPWMSTPKAGVLDDRRPGPGHVFVVQDDAYLPVLCAFLVVFIEGNRGSLPERAGVVLVVVHLGVVVALERIALRRQQPKSSSAVYGS